MLARLLAGAVAAAVTVAVAAGRDGDDDRSAKAARGDAGAGREQAARAVPEARGSGSRRVGLRRVGRFAGPTYVTAPPGDRRRLFVVERAGTIRVLVDGRRRSRPFLDIRGSVRTGGERGLLSMAFARDYATSGRFYVYFTDGTGDIRIQEFRRSADPNLADPASRRDLLRIGHRRFGNHNGGQLQTGPDGLLYIGTGDGGGANDSLRSGQDRRTLLGKLLRIDPRPGGGRPYRIPPRNPFRGGSSRPEIFAYGLRNPWRFSFDRRGGALTIADVGQDSQEEVDYAPHRGRGANYGWGIFEGRNRIRSGRVRRHHRPALVRSHSRGWCSVTGGYIVRDRALRGLYGRYVYGDLCRRGLRSVVLTRRGARRDRAVGVAVRTLVSFGEDARGRVYAVSLNGPVYRLVPR